jgi:hypothetical protein
VYDDQGRLVAGLSISAPADRIDESWTAKPATALDISTALGFSGFSHSAPHGTFSLPVR